MLLHMSQLHQVEDVERMLERYRVKPVVIRGPKLNYVWPPQPTGIPLKLLRYMPPDVYVVFRGRNVLYVVP